MKRMIGGLLAVLMLTGCAVSIQQPTEQSRTPEKLEMQQPTQSEGSDEAAQPAETPLPSGVTVRTDYSNYTPYTAPAEQFTRLSAERIDDLAPRDDYGTLYPFAGSLLYSYYAESGYESLNGELYGLFDEQGRIVADPTYTDISALTYYNPTDSSSVILPMLLLERTGEVEEVQYDDWTYFDGRSNYAIASLDGSFVTECKYTWVTGLECGVVARETTDEIAFTLFDFDGNVLLTEQDLSFRDRMETTYLDYGDGLLLAALDDGYYYFDLTGTLRLGPYRYANAFYQDRAVVSTDGESYGVIDLDGAWVVPPVYSYIGYATDGSLMARQSDAELCRLLDHDGNLLAERDADYMSEEPFGYAMYDWDGGAYYLDFDGTELLTDLDGVWSQDYGSPILTQTTDDGLAMYNLVSGATGTLPEGSYVSPLYSGGMDMTVGDLPYYQVIDESGERVLLDDSLQTVLAPEGSSWVYVLRDSVTGTNYAVWRDDSDNYHLMDGDLNELLTLTAEPTAWNGLIGTTDARYCTYTTLDGTVVFRYSLLTSQDD